MNTDHRYVVVGCGALGSAALYWLGRLAGARGGALGLEQHAIGQDRGASRDHSRIIRYAQDQDAYAALAPAAYDTWREVERVSGQQLVTETGGLVIEDVDERAGADIGVRGIGEHAAVADRHGVDFELLDARAVTARWPQFRLGRSGRAMYQRRSGIVEARRAAGTHVALARGHGVEIREHTPVRALRPTASGAHVEVVTDDEVYRAEHVVVTAGARAGELLSGLGRSLPLTVAREQVTSYATPNLIDFSPAAFPVFCWLGGDEFHGYPAHGEVTTKLGRRVGGREVTGEPRGVEPDPLGRERAQEFLAEHLPGFGGPELDTWTRRYTVPPDGHAVLDVVPEAPRVGVALGAGHGDELASLLGRILAEIATTGRTRHPVGGFALTRPALTRPALTRPGPTEPAVERAFQA